MVNETNMKKLNVRMNLVPKRNLEEQAKEALIREYTPPNQKKIDRFKQILKEIENETRRLLPQTKMIKILLEVFSFSVQFFLCCIIISIALPFIVLKVDWGITYRIIGRTVVLLNDLKK